MDNEPDANFLATRFFDNDSGYGFIINQPGIDPVICLNRTLLGYDPTNPLYQQVYSALMDYYHSLNIWEFVFPFRRFYEELPTAQPARAELIFHAVRVWRVTPSSGDGMRLVG